MSLADELHRLIPAPCNDRPFVCDGLPGSCDVVVIGENPATPMNGDWWRFWDGENGFNLGEFEHAYEEERRARGQRPISQARLRLMRLRSNGLKCLETNAYRNEQLGGAGIGAPNAALLAALIRHIPNKAVIVHGNVAREYWRELELPLPAGVQSYYLRAFRMESYEKIDEVSRKILGADQVKNPKAPAVKREAEEVGGEGAMTRMLGSGLYLAMMVAAAAAAAETPLTIDQLLAKGWEIAGYASGYDNRTSLILFRHPGINALVQCGILYDVTRVPRTVVNCYEPR
jgi:hypothetical protein